MTFRFLESYRAAIAVVGAISLRKKQKSGQALETCTLIGCDSAAVVSIQLSAGGIPKYDLRLDVDDAKVSCAFPELSGDVAFGSGMPCGPGKQTLPCVPCTLLQKLVLEKLKRC